MKLPVSKISFNFFYTSVFLFVLAIFTFNCGTIYALPHFYSLTQDNGLSNANINCILQDHNGFMWFGTNDGLNKFDGYEFTVYRNSPKDRHSISSNHITCMHEDANGVVWIGTKGGGLNAYDSKIDRFVRYQPPGQNSSSVLGNDILAIYENKEGTLWIGTDGAGLYRLNTNNHSVSAYIHDPFEEKSISSNEIIALESSSKGSMLVGTWSGGLNWFQPESSEFAIIPGNKGVNVNRIWQIVAHKNDIWIGTFGNGLIRLDAGTFKTENILLNKCDDNVDDKVIWAICADRDNQKWIGTNNGIYLVNPQNDVIAHYSASDNNDDALLSNKVLSIHQADNGIIWIGTDKGICYLNPDPKKFHIDLNIEMLKNTNIQALALGTGHSVWLGTDNYGIVHLSPKSSRHLDYEVNQVPIKGSSNIINCLIEDSFQRLWVGTRYGAKIYDRNRTLLKSIIFDAADLQNSSNDVTSVCETDTIGVFWLGTDNGLFLVNSFTWEIKKYTAAENVKFGLYSNHILKVFKDLKKNVWVSTWNGLSVFDSHLKKFIRCEDANLKNVYVNTMYDDASGNIWFGTRNGLYRYHIETGAVTLLREENGLCNNNICSIVDDYAGFLWVGTTNGLSRVNLSTLEIKNFDTFDGLINKNYNTNAGALVYNQFVFLGGNAGLDLFKPDEISINLHEPRIVLNDFRIFSKPVAIGAKGSPLKQSISATKSLVLTAKDAVFSIGFVALNYINTPKTKYLFKLQGFDKEWNEAGVERKATYTNLDAGDYVFKVRATNEDGIWGNEEKSLNIEVLPPWWKTLWFKVLLVLFVFGMISFYVSYRNYTYNQRNIQLEKIIKERTSEIREQKDKLAKQALKLTEQNYLLKEKSDEIQRQADEISRMNDLLKVRNINLSENVEELSRARVMNESVSFEDFQDIYPDDESCKKLIFELKEAQGFFCSSCNGTSYQIVGENYSRRCKKCGYVESVTVGTIFSHLKFPIVKAFYILYLVSGGHKLTVDQFSELISLRRETCWSFKNKVLKHMKQHKRFKNPQEGWKELILTTKRK